MAVTSQGMKLYRQPVIAFFLTFPNEMEMIEQENLEQTKRSRRKLHEE